MVIKDTKGDGYERIRTLLYADDILEQEKRNMPMFKISIRLYCWVEHAKTGSQNEKEFQERVITLKKKDPVNSKLNGIIDELLIHIENS